MDQFFLHDCVLHLVCRHFTWYSDRRCQGHAGAGLGSNLPKYSFEVGQRRDDRNRCSFQCGGHDSYDCHRSSRPGQGAVVEHDGLCVRFPPLRVPAHAAVGSCHVAGAGRGSPPGQRCAAVRLPARRRTAAVSTAVSGSSGASWVWIPDGLGIPRVRGLRSPAAGMATTSAMAARSRFAAADCSTQTRRR